MSNSEPVKVQESGTVTYQPVAEDAVDLLDILMIFKKRWRLMLGIVVFVSLATVVIVLQLPRVYRAEVVINPPLARDVEQFNIFDVDKNDSVEKKVTTGNYFYKITEIDVYDQFVRFLNSKKLQYEFYKNNNLFEHLKGDKDGDIAEREVFYKKFSNQIDLLDLRRKNRNMLESVAISLEGLDEKLIVKWLNKYVIHINEHTIKSIAMAISERARLQTDTINKQINSLRETEKDRRFDLIEQYKEAVVIAERIGMTDQVSISLAPYNQLVEKKGVTFNPGDIPLYLRGSNALQAELNLLQQRKNDDPFIFALRDLQQRLEFLSGINVTVNESNAANVDQFAYVSGKPVKPKRMLIFVIGLFFGCLLAVFSALAKHWYETIKNR